MNVLSQQFNRKSIKAKEDGNFESAKAYGTAAALAMQEQVRSELDAMSNEEVFSEMLKYYLTENVIQNFLERLYEQYPGHDKHVLQKIVLYLVDEKQFGISDETEIVPVPWTKIEVPVYGESVLDGMITKMITLENYGYRDDKTSGHLLCAYHNNRDQFFCFKQSVQSPSNNGLQPERNRSPQF